MEPLVYGEIVTDHVVLSRRLKRKMCRAISDWIKDHSQTEDEARAFYTVTLKREPNHHSVKCQLEIIEKSQAWVRSERANHPYRALSRCLLGLTPLELMQSA